MAMGETVQVPAYSEMEVMVNLTQTPTSGTWIMEGDTTPIIVARSLHNNSTGEIPVRLLNPTAESVTLYKFREARLKLKASKCALCQEKVEFLGHIVSANRVATDPKKTEKVANWPVPRSRREVQQFLGLANYYRRFVQDYERIAKPLHHLTEKNTTFKWTSECECSFENLRQNLVSAPVLALPDCSRPFI